MRGIFVVETALDMKDKLSRIEAKLVAKGHKVNSKASEAHVASFESHHGISLPGEYRSFITLLGNGGPGPPSYGLEPLGFTASDMQSEERRLWTDLPDVATAFPFTRYWVWEEGDISSEGSREQIDYGSIYIGNDGCGMHWHLIITGPERGIPWMICGEGIQPVCPRRSFLQWYEDWLDGLDSFYGFPESAV